MHSLRIFQRRFGKPALLVAGLVSLLFYFLRHNSSILSAVSRNPANATLGFGSIYVVSGPGSPRKAHILEAAAVTELDLTIPEQVLWTEDDVRAFQIPDYENSAVRAGSIKAWLSHHLVLKKFLESGEETALILEDDVDWDIRLRTKQIPLAQRAVRSLLKEPKVPKTEYPWASPEAWDLLYVGHCGDYFGQIEHGVGVGHHHPDDLERVQHVLYSDPTMLSNNDLHPFTSSLLKAFEVPEKTRVLHRSQWPLCTFGYAVNRRSAQRILTEIAPANEEAGHHITAYDAAILTGCRDRVITCYTLQPELLHHMEGESLISVVDHFEDKPRPPVDAVGLDQVKLRGETSNIGCGFWSGEFYFGDDKPKFEHLLKEVGRRGKCLKKKFGYS